MRLSPRSWVDANNPNWAGFILPGLTNYRFHEITTLTEVPTAHCTTKENSLVNVWAGLGGTTSTVSLVQSGIALGCLNGRPGYGAWAEWYDPKRRNHERVQKSFHVAPGGKLYIYITEVSPTRYQVFMQETTSNDALIGQSTTILTDPGGEPLGNSAECVVERPELAGGGYQPVTDFGMVKFQYCTGSDYGTFTDATHNTVDVVDGVQWKYPGGLDSLPEIKGATFVGKRWNLVVGGDTDIHSTAIPNLAEPNEWVGLDSWTHH